VRLLLEAGDEICTDMDTGEGFFFRFVTTRVERFRQEYTDAYSNKI